MTLSVGRILAAEHSPTAGGAPGSIANLENFLKLKMYTSSIPRVPILHVFHTDQWIMKSSRWASTSIVIYLLFLVLEMEPRAWFMLCNTLPLSYIPSPD
jgi:hypothetical protein